MSDDLSELGGTRDALDKGPLVEKIGNRWEVQAPNRLYPGNKGPTLLIDINTTGAP